ncbi:MAG: glycosyltransferase family 4 protein [Rhizobacter sp.]
MSLKVVHVVRQYLPSKGGMEDVVFNIARTQRDLHGQAPRVITLDRVFRQPEVLPTDEVIEGIPVHRMRYSGSERYPLFPAVLNKVADADVVHVHGIDFAFDYLSLTRFLHRKPMVACTHGGFFHTSFAQRAKKLFFHSVTRATARGYHRILASSANDGEMFRQVVPQERVRVIENGVDIDKFADAASTTLTQTLIYVGRWTAHKGLDRTMALLAALRRTDPAWKLIVAGREYDDINREKLAQMAQDAGVTEAVTILPNPDNETIRAAMAQASYAVCLSSHEGFGLAAIEAMSAGLIPVLSAIPPFERLAGETALPLIVPNDIGEAAVAVQALHGRVASSHGALRAAAQRSVQRYSWRNVVGAYVEEYERAVQEARFAA